MTTILIHGFWGQPADWNHVLHKLPLGEVVWAPDLYEAGPLAPHHSMAEWISHFWQEVDERMGSSSVQAVGYSMGGRLLAEAIHQRPDRLTRALLLSARPARVPREERSTFDLEWRDRFLEEDWETLEKAWQDQSVFMGSQSVPRRRSPILREMLGQSLVHWSPTGHQLEWDELQDLPDSVDWAFGALDQKYVEVAKGLQKQPVRGQITLLENAGHRIPSDRADWVSDWIQKRG
ncbi:MAG: alpha/beta fold hydrolase [Bdellovibrionales bacterium]